MATLIENVVRVVNALDDIKNAITEKGGRISTGKCQNLGDDIRGIPQEGGGGTDVSDTTAIADDVLFGKIFHIASGRRVEGAMPDNGAIVKTLDSEEVFTIPLGFHNGEGKLTAPKSYSPCKVGVLNSIAGSPIKVDCGFVPNCVLVTSMMAANPQLQTTTSVETAIYIEKSPIKKLGVYKTSASSTSAVFENTANANLRITVTTDADDFDGFYFTGRMTKPCYYMAIQWNDPQILTILE